MDKYDEAVAHLTEHPDEIAIAWRKPGERKGGILFTPASPLQPEGFGVNCYPFRDDGQQCGCLTFIRQGRYVAWTDDLTTRIQADGRLPKDFHDIRPEHPPAFAEWQRRLDREVRGVTSGD